MLSTWYSAGSDGRSFRAANRQSAPMSTPRNPRKPNRGTSLGGAAVQLQIHQNPTPSSSAICFPAPLSTELLPSLSTPSANPARPSLYELRTAYAPATAPQDALLADLATPRMRLAELLACCDAAFPKSPLYSAKPTAAGARLGKLSNSDACEPRNTPTSTPHELLASLARIPCLAVAQAK